METLEQKIDILIESVKNIQEEISSLKRMKIRKKALVAPTKVYKKLNQSELIRNYFKEHGLEVRNKNIIDVIKRKDNIEIAPSLVSIIRSKMKEFKGKNTSLSSIIKRYFEKNGLESSNEQVLRFLQRIKIFDAKPNLISSIRMILKKRIVQNSTVEEENKKGPSMPSVIIEALKNGPEEGMNLSQVAEKVLSYGYNYQGKKDLAGLTQNVYQTLHALSKSTEDTNSIVFHDKDARKYRLNLKIA